jgi:hypothetical protein
MKKEEAIDFITCAEANCSALLYRIRNAAFGKAFENLKEDQRQVILALFCKLAPVAEIEKAMSAFKVKNLDLDNLKLTELRELGKAYGVKGYLRLSKADLIDVIKFTKEEFKDVDPRVLSILQEISSGICRP